MPPTDVSRDLGRHDAEIEALQREVARLAEAVRDLSDEVTKVRNTLDAARGGWKVLMLMGGAAAAVGGFAREIAQAFLAHSD